MKTTITVIVDTDTESVIPAVLEHITASLGTLLIVNEVTATASASAQEPSRVWLKTPGEYCVHGVKWANPCRDCDIARRSS